MLAAHDVALQRPFVNLPPSRVQPGENLILALAYQRLDLLEALNVVSRKVKGVKALDYDGRVRLEYQAFEAVADTAPDPELLASVLSRACGTLLHAAKELAREIVKRERQNTDAVIDTMERQFTSQRSGGD